MKEDPELLTHKSSEVIDHALCSPAVTWTCCLNPAAGCVFLLDTWTTNAESQNCGMRHMSVKDFDINGIRSGDCVF